MNLNELFRTRELALTIARETGITREQLISPTPSDSMDLVWIRRITWAYEQFEPEYRKLMSMLDLTELFGTDLYPSGITVLSARPDVSLVGLRMDADDFHEGTFDWNGVRFDPFYHKTEPDDGSSEEWLVVNWERIKEDDSTPLRWRLSTSNMQSFELKATDAVYARSERGQALLSLPLAVEGARNSYFLEIKNLDHQTGFTWIDPAWSLRGSS